MYSITDSKIEKEDHEQCSQHISNIYFRLCINYIEKYNFPQMLSTKRS